MGEERYYRMVDEQGLGVPNASDVVASAVRDRNAESHEAGRRRAEEWARAVEGGETCTEVARRVGVSRQRVHQVLKRYGYPTVRGAVE